MGKVPGGLCTNANSIVSPVCYSPAEESAPNHSCQSPSPASQDGEEEKEGALFPERMVSTRNAKVKSRRWMGGCSEGAKILKDLGMSAADGEGPLKESETD